MGVLVAPEWRRRGLGSLAASIAAHEALAAGLTLQWRSDVSNKGSLAHGPEPGLLRRRHPDQRPAGLTGARGAASAAAVPGHLGRRPTLPAQPRRAVPQP